MRQERAELRKHLEAEFERQCNRQRWDEHLWYSDNSDDDSEDDDGGGAHHNPTRRSSSSSSSRDPSPPPQTLVCLAEKKKQINKNLRPKSIHLYLCVTLVFI